MKKGLPYDLSPDSEISAFLQANIFWGGQGIWSNLMI